MPNRMISLERNTNETQIDLTLDLDGTGRYEVDTGCGFLNHMLELFARHGRFDLVLTCHGDVQVDYHHTTEDVGIALGQAFARALGDMRGIQRYGSFYLPMDEALILCAVEGAVVGLGVELILVHRIGGVKIHFSVAVYSSLYDLLTKSKAKHTKNRVATALLFI